MAINIIRSELVKPSEATPQSPVWLSNLDLGARNSYSPMIYLFRTQSDDCLGFFSADALRTALTRALVPFYPLAGRLGMAPDGRVEIDCNAEGCGALCAHMRVFVLHPHGPHMALHVHGTCAGSQHRVPALHNGRHACPPLAATPDAYFGYASVRTSVSAKVGDLLSNPLNFGSRRVRMATGQGDEYTRSLVDYLETADVRSKPGRELPDTDLRVISWMGMASQDADFGWGEPVLIAPAVMSYTWFIYNIGNNGDVAVAVAMKPDHLERFKELFFDDNEM
ncbi:unnamed protein product [Alopecurus aequalis]